MRDPFLNISSFAAAILPQHVYSDPHENPTCLHPRDGLHNIHD